MIVAMQELQPSPLIYREGDRKKHIRHRRDALIVRVVVLARAFAVTPGITQRLVARVGNILCLRGALYIEKVERSRSLEDLLSRRRAQCHRSIDVSASRVLHSRTGLR